MRTWAWKFFMLSICGSHKKCKKFFVIKNVDMKIKQKFNWRRQKIALNMDEIHVKWHSIWKIFNLDDLTNFILSHNSVQLHISPTHDFHHVWHLKIFFFFKDEKKNSFELPAGRELRDIMWHLNGILWRYPCSDMMTLFNEFSIGDAVTHKKHSAFTSLLAYLKTCYAFLDSVF